MAELREIMRAILYLPAGGDTEYWRQRCTRYCEEHGYRIIGVIVGTNEEQWMELRQMAAREEYDVIVVGRWEHLPPLRRPRIEAVEMGPSGKGPA